MKQTNLDRTRQLLTGEGGRILIIQTAFLGDVILTTPLIRALRESFPKSSLSAVVIPECRDVVDGMVDEIIELDKRSSSNRKKLTTALVREVRRRGFHVALIPHRSLRSAYIAKSAGIPVRIGFNRGGGKFLHNHLVPYTYGMYEGRRNLMLTGSLGAEGGDCLPKLMIRDEDIACARDTIKSLSLEPDRFYTVAPGSVWRTKRWSSDQYRELMKLIEKRGSLKALFVGGGDDRDLCAAITEGGAFNLAGRLTIRQSAAIIMMSRFLISGDTAPAHLATAVEARQLIIMGSTSPRFGFFPPTPKARLAGLNLWCRPCTDHGRQRCPLFIRKFRCLNDITPRYAYELLADWIEN